jgi:hypothetical protein
MGTAPYGGRGGVGAGAGAKGQKAPAETLAQLQARNKKLEADNKKLAAAGGTKAAGTKNGSRPLPLDNATKKLQLRLKEGKKMLELWPNAKAWQDEVADAQLQLDAAMPKVVISTNQLHDDLEQLELELEAQTEVVKEKHKHLKTVGD